MEQLVSARLSLYVWGGSIASVPEEPQYVLSKTKLSTEDIITFEISELVKDHVDIEFNGDYNTIVQSKWAKWIVVRTYSDNSTDTFTQHAIAFRGYGNISDGVNPELSKDVMMSNTTVSNLCGQYMTLPVYSYGEGGVTDVTYIQGSSEIESIVTGSSERFTIAQGVHLNPPATDILTIDKTFDTTSSNNNTISTTLLSEGADEVVITSSDGTTKVIKIQCIEECKNIPNKVSFINKFGVMQDIWFFAKRKDSFSSKNESYKKSILNINSSVSYDISSHQNVVLENQGKEKITMNTGFVDESYNEVIKEMLVSEYVYISHSARRSPTDSSFPLAIPVSVITSSLDIKTRRDDKLIEYTLEFEADSDFIQSVR
jgi:hypothetical protein